MGLGRVEIDRGCDSTERDKHELQETKFVRRVIVSFHSFFV